MILKKFPERIYRVVFLSQSYIRKINDLGLRVNYETNHKLAFALKMLPSFAFEKKEDARVLRYDRLGNSDCPCRLPGNVMNERT